MDDHVQTFSVDKAREIPTETIEAMKEDALRIARVADLMRMNSHMVVDILNGKHALFASNPAQTEIMARMLRSVVLEMGNKLLDVIEAAEGGNTVRKYVCTCGKCDTADTVPASSIHPEQAGVMH